MQPVTWSATGNAVSFEPAASHPQPQPAQGGGEDRAAALQARVAQLEREVETARRAAHQAGFEEGRAAEARQSASRVDPLLQRLAATIAEVAAIAPRTRAESEQDLISLAIAIARRVLRRELSVDQDALAGIVSAALDRLDRRDVTSVRANPEDAEPIRRHLAALGVPPRVEVCADPSLERGSVVVETSRGNLDASVSTQLSEIERGLVDLLRRPQP